MTRESSWRGGIVIDARTREGGRHGRESNGEREMKIFEKVMFFECQEQLCHLT